MRLDYWRAAPEEFRALVSLQLRLKTGVEPKLFELVCLHVSQINGCAFCVDLHTAELRKAGETEQRIDALTRWRDAPDFSAPERSALDWTEKVTGVHDARSLDAACEALRSHYPERQIAVLTIAVSVMNAINRIAIAGGRKPTPERGRATPVAPALQ